MYFTSIDDYEFSWYEEDISGKELNLIEGNNTNILGNLNKKYDYKLVARNKNIPELSIEKTYFYSDRTVVYVDQRSGSGYNDGFAPNRAVQTFAQAYSKLQSNKKMEQNVIVVMGEYTNTDAYSGTNNTTYMKNATITGIYKNNEYNGYMYFTGYNTYRYLNGNTTFMYLTFDGRAYQSSGWWGGSWEPSQLYFYLQGYNLVMGEGLHMVNYQRSNENQGLIAGNAPAFHIFAAWHRYDMARLPRTNSKILIKSGTYGRIILRWKPGYK